MWSNCLRSFSGQVGLVWAPQGSSSTSHRHSRPLYLGLSDAMLVGSTIGSIFHDSWQHWSRCCSTAESTVRRTTAAVWGTGAMAVLSIFKYASVFRVVVATSPTSWKQTSFHRETFCFVGEPRLRLGAFNGRPARKTDFCVKKRICSHP